MVSTEEGSVHDKRSQPRVRAGVVDVDADEMPTAPAETSRLSTLARSPTSI